MRKPQSDTEILKRKRRGERLKEVLKFLKIDQEQLADFTNKTQGTISNYVTGKSDIDIAVLDYLVNEKNTNVFFIMNNEEPMILDRAIQSSTREQLLLKENKELKEQLDNEKSFNSGLRDLAKKFQDNKGEEERQPAKEKSPHTLRKRDKEINRDT